MSDDEKKPQTKHTALKMLTGADAAIAAWNNTVSAPTDGAKMTGNLLKKFFLANKQTYRVESSSDDPAVRFDVCMRDGEVSEKELAWRIRFSARVFNAILICLGLIFAGIIIHPPSLHGSWMLAFMYFVIAGSGLSVLSSVLVQWGYFNYQLRNRTLAGVGVYLRSPGEWFPSFTETPSKKRSVGRGSMVALALMTGLMAAAPSVASADTSTTTTTSDSCSSGNGYVLDTFSMPCKSDLFRNALEVIFPDVGPLTAQTLTIGVNGYSENTNGQSAVAEAFMAFICVLFFVGASTLTWHTITLIVNMSQEGAAIQQRWSGVWTTSRMFFGAGLLAPYVKGYCLANVLVLYAALWSGSLGNIIYNAYLDGLTQPQISSTAILPGITPTLQNLAVRDLCYNITKLQNQRATEAGTTPANSGVPSSVSTPSSSGVGYGDARSQSYQQTLAQLQQPWNRSGDTAATQSSTEGVSTEVYSTWDFGPACGQVSLMTPDPNASSVFSTYAKSEVNAITSFVKDFDAAVQKVIAQQIGNDTAVSSDATADVATISQNYADGTSKVYSAISSAAYSMLNNANSGNMQSLISGAQKYGWATSGAFYMNMSRMQGLFDEFLSRTPEADPKYSAQQAAQIQKDINDFAQKLKRDGAYADFYNQNVSAISNTNASSATTSDGSASGELRQGSSAGSFYNMNINTNSTWMSNPESYAGRFFTYLGNAIGDFTTKMISGLTGSGTVYGQSSTNQASGSELEKMTEFGQNVLSLVYSLFVLMMTASVAAAVVPASKFTAVAMKFADATGVIGTMIARVVGVLTWIMGGLFVIGATHAYILPMMPYIQVLMFILSMIVLVMEAMIAAPIWALMHFRLDGQAFVGEHQRAGYMIMFNMFLRIPVAMLGMLLSISVFNATILVMSVTFYPAVESATDGGGGSGFLGSLVMLGMMTYLHYQIAIRSFSLVSTVPGQVGRWFGANDAGDPGHGVMQGVSGFLVGQATAGSSALMQNALGARQPNGGGGGGPRAGTATTNPNGGGGGDPVAQVSPSGGAPSGGGDSSIDAGGGGGGGAAGNSESATPAGGVAGNMGWDNVASNVRRNSRNATAVANFGGDAAVGDLMRSIMTQARGQSASDAISSGSMQRGIEEYFANEGITPTPEARNAADHLAHDAMNQWTELNGDAAIQG